MAVGLFLATILLMLQTVPAAHALTRLSSAEEWQAAPREEQVSLVAFFLSGLRFSTELERRRFSVPVSDETFLVIKRTPVDPAQITDRMHGRLASLPQLRPQAVEHLFLATVTGLDRDTLRNMAADTGADEAAQAPLHAVC